MSDAPSNPSSTGGQSADPAPPAEQPKKTSLLGRIVIGILLVVLAVEAFAHFRVTWAKSELSEELARAEAEEYTVTRQNVQEILGGREPDQTERVKVAVGEELYDVYYYKGLLKDRVLCVHYSVEGRADVDDSEREMMEVMSNVPEVVLRKGAR